MNADYQPIADQYSDRAFRTQGFPTAEHLRRKGAWKRKGHQTIAELQKNPNGTLQIAAMAILKEIPGLSSDDTVSLYRHKSRAIWRVDPMWSQKFLVMMPDSRYRFYHQESK